MKRKELFLTLALTLALAQPVFAADSHGHDSHGHGSHGGGSQEMAGHEMGSKEVKIHESKVNGYQFTYQLIDNLAQLAAAKKAGKAQEVDMSKVKSNHLMLYIKTGEGKMVGEGKVGFLVKGPDGKDQTIMTMLMDSGFGADIEMKTPGNYTIKSKAAVAGQNLLDEFVYNKK